MEFRAGDYAIYRERGNWALYMVDRVRNSDADVTLIYKSDPKMLVGSLGLTKRFRLEYLEPFWLQKDDIGLMGTMVLMTVQQVYTAIGGDLYVAYGANKDEDRRLSLVAFAGSFKFM